MKLMRGAYLVALMLVVGCSKPQVAPGTRAKVKPKPKPTARSQEYHVGQQVGVIDEFVQGATGATAVGAYQHTRGQISDIKRQKEQQGQ